MLKNEWKTLCNLNVATKGAITALGIGVNIVFNSQFLFWVNNCPEG